MEECLNQGAGALTFLAETEITFQIIIFIYYHMGEIKILEEIRRVMRTYGRKHCVRSPLYLGQEFRQCCRGVCTRLWCSPHNARHRNTAEMLELLNV